MRLARIVLLLAAVATLGACAGADAPPKVTYLLSDLRVTYPTDGETVATVDILVLGTAPAGVTVNRNIPLAPDQETVADSSGNWSMAIHLGLGDNTLRFRISGIPDLVVHVTYDPTTSTPSPSPTAGETPTVPVTVGATASQGSIRSPTPTQASTPSAAGEPETTVTFTTFPSSVARGTNATVGVKTAPRASCSISVVYKSGPSTAVGLGDKAASATGAVSWTWRVGSKTTTGSWPVTVRCSAGGSFGSATNSLIVR